VPGLNYNLLERLQNPDEVKTRSIIKIKKPNGGVKEILRPCKGGASKIVRMTLVGSTGELDGGLENKTCPLSVGALK